MMTIIAYLLHNDVRLFNILYEVCVNLSQQITAYCTMLYNLFYRKYVYYKMITV